MLLYTALFTHGEHRLSSHHKPCSLHRMCTCQLTLLTIFVNWTLPEGLLTYPTADKNTLAFGTQHSLRLSSVLCIRSDSAEVLCGIILEIIVLRQSRLVNDFGRGAGSANG